MMITKKTILLFCALVLAQALLAVPALQTVRIEKQANGKELAVKLQGDEFFHFTTTEDGYLVEKNSEGNYEYASFDAEGKIALKGVLAHNASERTLSERRFLKKQTIDFAKVSEIRQKNSETRTKSMISKAFPLKDTIPSLVILVEFSDIKFVTQDPQQKFSDLLNKEGYNANGATGSARDYFKANSMETFVPRFDVYGPFTLDKPSSYYGGNDAQGNDKNPRAMVSDACKKAAEAGVDFKIYDTDNNGVVDNIFIYYAGHNEAEGATATTVWPHRWTAGGTFGGKQINDYACTSELRGKSGSTMCGIGTFCHEFGHVLGLPDFYDTQDGSHVTLGIWDIMASGSYNNDGRTPPCYSAYERFMLGWLKPTLLKDPALLTLDTLSSSNTAFLIAKDSKHNLCNGKPFSQVKPNPTEFLLLENRQQTGWDKFLPEHGLLITRIRYNASKISSNKVNNDKNDMGYAIMKSTASSNTFPGSFDKKGYIPTMLDGTDLQQPITYIEEKGGKISFRYKGGGEGFSQFSINDHLPLFTTVAETPSDSQELVVAGRWLEKPYRLEIVSGANSNFEYRSKNDTEWHKKRITINPKDSVIQDTILVRYVPSTPTFDSCDNDTILVECDPFITLPVYLTGQALRKIKVEIPEVLAADSITNESFVAHWKGQEFANGYYVSVYSEEMGKNRSVTEGFKGLDNNTWPFDWQSTFTKKNTNNYGIATPSVVFSDSKDTLTTERYFLPIEKIGFWLKNNQTTGSNFKVEALSNNNWEPIFDTTIVATDNDMNIEVPLDTAKHYNRFRFTFNKNRVGNLYFDDFALFFTKNVKFSVRSHYVTEPQCKITNLAPDTEYKYYVQASERKTENNKLLYEDITDASAEMAVKTAFSQGKNLFIGYDSETGLYFVKIAEETLSSNRKLFIFDIQGHLVEQIEPKNTSIYLPNLQNNTIYIVRCSEPGKWEKDDPRAKFLYRK